MNEITVKQAQKWANALRSGKYQQGQGSLEIKPEHYCCLGVACKVFIPEEKLEYYQYEKRLLGGFPLGQVHAPQWLKDINSDFNNKVGKSLSDLNDGLSVPHNFDMIADLIELVYVHKAL